jgi:hypothetical protein
VKNTTMDQEKTIVYMEFASAGEASIVKGALESNSIPCFLSNENNPYKGPFMSDALYGVRLHIFEKDKEKADELMVLIRSAADEDDLWGPEDLEDVSD